MADLNGQGVQSVRFEDVPGLPHKIGIWLVKLSGEATDTFTVPNLSNSTVSLGILLRGAADDPEVLAEAAQASITVTAAANEGSSLPGEAIVTVTNSVTARKRNTVVITTLHPKQNVSFAGRDVDAT